MFLISILAAALLAVDTPPPVPSQPVPSPRVRSPDWRRIPTLEEMADHYPDRAMRTGVEGAAVLTCAVALTGRLEDCAVHSENPRDMGFGEAALGLAPLFEVSPRRVDGKAVGGGRIAFRIAFRLPFDERIDLNETLRCYGLLSAHLALAPDDGRLAGGVAQARDRATTMAEARGEAAGLENRLARAIEQAPRPKRAGATTDVCFQLFL